MENIIKEYIKNKNLRNERAVVFPKNIFVKDAMQEITTLGDEAFRDFKNLESIILPPSLELINFKAFEGCEHLHIINIPQNVKSIKPVYTLFTT